MVRVSHLISDVRGVEFVAEKFVSTLSKIQKNYNMISTKKLLSNLNNDPDLLKRVIYDDENWVYCYESKPNHPNGSDQ